MYVLSLSLASLLLALLLTYFPVLTRPSVPSTTPPGYEQATMVVPVCGADVLAMLPLTYARIATSSLDINELALSGANSCF